MKTKKTKRIFISITLTILIGVLSFFAHQLTSAPETPIGLAPVALTHGVQQMRLFRQLIFLCFLCL